MDQPYQPGGPLAAPSSSPGPARLPYAPPDSPAAAPAAAAPTAGAGKPSSPGGIRLFRLFGVDVFLHWTWFIVFLIQYRRSNAYDSIAWYVGEVLVLFGIVLLH